MRSIEWWHCPWPWVPPNHPIFCMLYCHSLRVLLETSNLVYRLTIAIPLCRWKIIHERGVFRFMWLVLEFYTPWNISWMAWGRDVTNFVSWLAMWSISLVITDCLLNGHGQGYVGNFYILDLENFAKFHHSKSSVYWCNQQTHRRPACGLHPGQSLPPKWPILCRVGC